MVEVKTVREFARKNEKDLKKFMQYKTGIYDEDLIKEAVQEFYVKLIETKSLLSYNPSLGTFKTYITNLFCWQLPQLGRKNFRQSKDVVSVVKNDKTYQNDYDEVWNCLGREDHRSGISFVLHPNYHTSNMYYDEEFAAENMLEAFISYVEKTEPPKKAQRTIEFLRRRMEGCNSVDLASILDLSNNMVKIIKNSAYDKYKRWRHEVRY